MYLFFDTETTGLPRNWKAPVTDTNNWPRMVQIAWILSDKNGNRIESKEYIIKPDGYNIPSDASRVHRITTQRAVDEGVNLLKVLKEFNELITKSDVIVAHNIDFDKMILGAEFVRNSIKSEFHFKPKLCTMKASTDYCRIPGNYGYKWPKLSELHQVLFNEGFDEAHDASVDINATERCFWEMKKLNIL